MKFISAIASVVFAACTFVAAAPAATVALLACTAPNYRECILPPLISESGKCRPFDHPIDLRSFAVLEVEEEGEGICQFFSTPNCKNGSEIDGGLSSPDVEINGAAGYICI